MAKSDIESVLTVFRGIGDRDAELAIKNMHPTKYKQHNPYASDGVAGVRDWIARLPREKSPLTTVRAFQDGPYVFTQTEGDLFGQKMFFDVFKLANGLIVEHWVFSTEAAPPNQSGHTQTDGPTRAQPGEDTEQNKSIVREYYEAVHLSGDHGKVLQYSSDRCIRHEPGAKDGLDSFLRDLEAATRNGRASRSIDEIKILLGQGDFVFVAAEGSVNGEPAAYIDLYRLEDRKIAEHWGFSEKVPPRTDWKNDNGML